MSDLRLGKRSVQLGCSVIRGTLNTTASNSSGLAIPGFSVKRQLLAGHVRTSSLKAAALWGRVSTRTSFNAEVPFALDSGPAETNSWLESRGATFSSVVECSSVVLSLTCSLQ